VTRKAAPANEAGGPSRELTLKRDTIAIAGSLAQKPGRGGHTWVLLQYLLGFQRLGWDVLLLDRLETEVCVDDAGRPCHPEESWNLRYFLQVMRGFGLDDAFALIVNGGERFIGLSERQVLERVRSAACLVNVNGFLTDQAILGAAPRCVYLDIDPGFAQMWHALGLPNPLGGHDSYVTIAENIGRAGCCIPTCGLDWLTTRPPVVLEHWPWRESSGVGCFSSIARWRGAFGPVTYQGRTYGLRVHEFRKFAHLPRMSQQSFRLALDIHPSEANDLALLAAGGWVLDNPAEAAGDPWTYRTYIQNSIGEFLVAKNMYVQTQCGWFSDRSVCYLASGRPVLAQDTGLRWLYSMGAGLLTFSTLDEARASGEAVARDYGRHAQAARRLAEAYFDSDKVLRRLLDSLKIGSSA
jgi:hypothetical protein